MNKEAHAYTCEMGGVFFSKVLPHLSLEEMLYWTRHPEELLGILKRPDPILIGESSETFTLPATSEKEIGAVFNSSSPFKRAMPRDWIRRFLQPTYRGTFITKDASWHPLLCGLLPSEILNVLGGDDMLTHIHFTPQQIRLLASKQNTVEKTDGPLSFKVTNYFPMVGKKAETIFLAVRWSPTFPSYKKNQWDLFFPHAQFVGGEKTLKKGARLFIMC